MLYAFEEKYLPPHDHHMAAEMCKKHEALGWPGLLGSLDCSHWVWAKCPTSLQGEFKKGSKERPTVVYECACDSDLFIWHCFFALPGACSDINVLDVSPLLFSIASGKTMAEFSVDGSVLNQPYVSCSVAFHNFSLLCQLPSCRRYLPRLDVFLGAHWSTKNSKRKPLRYHASCSTKRHRACIRGTPVKVAYSQ